MNAKGSMLLAATMAMAAGAGMPLIHAPKAPPAWKPKFTDEELAYIRQLPKKERELAVRDLRRKYWELECSKK